MRDQFESKIREPFVNAAALAAHLGMSPRTVAKWAREVRIPAHPVSGTARRTWRFKLSDVESFLASQMSCPYSRGVPAALQKASEQMQQRRKRYQSGCVYMDAKTRTWLFRYYVDGRRRAKRIGTKAEYPTRAQVMRAAEPIRVRCLAHGDSRLAPFSLAGVWEGYAKEKMPERASTKWGYLVWANNYILPKWGQVPLPDIKARAVELWLSGLDLAPKSKSNIRMALSVLFEYAMWAELIPLDRNPMELVRIKNAPSPDGRHGQLRMGEFHLLCSVLTEPYRTMAIVSVCLGLRWRSWLDCNGTTSSTGGVEN